MKVPKLRFSYHKIIALVCIIGIAISVIYRFTDAEWLNQILIGLAIVVGVMIAIVAVVGITNGVIWLCRVCIKSIRRWFWN